MLPLPFQRRLSCEVILNAVPTNAERGVVSRVPVLSSWSPRCSLVAQLLTNSPLFKLITNYSHVANLLFAISFHFFKTFLNVLDIRSEFSFLKKKRFIMAFKQLFNISYERTRWTAFESLVPRLDRRVPKGNVGQPPSSLILLIPFTQVALYHSVKCSEAL